MLYKLILTLNLLFATEPEHSELSQIHPSDQVESQTFQTIPDFLKTVLKTQRRTLGRPSASSTEPENCCGIPGKCHSYLCVEVNNASRMFWKFVHSTSWTASGLANYARRFMIPLVAFGNYDTTDQQNLLIGIGILQIIGESCEVIYDFSENQFISREEKLKDLHLRRKNEKNYVRTKAILRCANHTIPNISITSAYLEQLNTSQQLKFTKSLHQVYEPRSRYLTALDEELTDATQLTGCEVFFEKIMFIFWTKSYPVFWGLGITFSLAQLFIIAVHLEDPNANLILACLIAMTETINFFSERMKNIGQNEKLQHEKLRKDYKKQDPENLV